MEYELDGWNVRLEYTPYTEPTHESERKYLTVVLKHDDGSEIIPCEADIGEDSEWAERFTTKQIEDTYKKEGDLELSAPHATLEICVEQWKIFASTDVDDHLGLYISWSAGENNDNARPPIQEDCPSENNTWSGNFTPIRDGLDELDFCGDCKKNGFSEDELSICATCGSIVCDNCLNMTKNDDLYCAEC